MANNLHCPSFLDKIHGPIYEKLKQLESYKNLTKEEFLNIVSYWMLKNNKTENDVPTLQEWLTAKANSKRNSGNTFSWGRYSKDSYEVSSSGDKRFSALYAIFKPGTEIFGVNVGGMTIENVYQKIVKKSGKGQKPSEDSILYHDPVERKEDSKFLNTLPKELAQAIMDDFIGEKKATSEQLEDYSYYRGYLPLWKEWAKQNPGLIEELRSKVKNKMLTDKYANTRVSQARALADILNETESFSSYKQIKQDTIFSVSKSTAYPVRTKENADWSDITLALAENFNSRGEQKTLEVAGNKYVSSQLIENVDEIANRIYNQIKAKGKLSNIKLNIAGNGIYSLRKDQEYYNNLVTQVLQKLIDRGVTIAEIRSGGQTGIDEAGIIAAQRLGIPNTVHTTADYKFRGKDHKDISDEAAFKARFNQPTQSQQQTQFNETATQVNPAQRKEVLGSEEQTELANSSIRLPWKNATQRKDRANMLSRQFTRLATIMFNKYVDKLSKKAENGNQTALDELGSIARKRFVVEHIDEILQRLKDSFDDRNSSVEAITKLYRAKGKDIPSEDILKQESTYRTQEYGKIRDNFYYLLQEANNIIKVVEGISINTFNGEIVQDFINNESNSDNPNDDGGNLDGEENTVVKDGWMIKARQLNDRDTLSTITRNIIIACPKIDSKGRIETDDLGNRRYYEPDYVHQIVRNYLSKNITKPTQMMDALKDLSKSYNWVRTIITKLTDKDSDDEGTRIDKYAMRAKFFMDMYKEFNPYRVERTKQEQDGTVSVKTKNVNDKPDISFVLNSWRNIIESGDILDDLSIYNKDGEPVLDKDITKQRVKLIDDLKTKINNTVPEDTSITKAHAFLIAKDDTKKSEKAEIKQHIEELHRVAKILGIRIPVQDMIDSLVVGNNIFKFLDAARFIANNLNQVGFTIDEEGVYNYDDILNKFGKKSKIIANALNYIPENAAIQSSREAGKSYTSYTPVSYKGRIINALQRVDMDFIEQQFGQVDWFRDKDGVWFNDIIDRIVNEPNAREIIEQKTVLHRDKKEFNSWGQKEYLLSMLTEFTANDDGTAWYAVPLMADVESADYFRFYKYSESQIIEKLTKTVLQEFGRIQLVLNRADSNKTDKNFRRIDNYDIKKDKDGNDVGVVKDKNNKIRQRKDGAEFKFFPQLNTEAYDVEVDGERLTFLERLTQLILDKNTKEAYELIQSAIYDIMESQFETELKNAEKLGLFETVTVREYKNGKPVDKIKYKYFPNIKTEDDLKALFKSFHYNYTHMWNQQLQLYTTDIAFYPNVTQLNKRLKEIYAMTIKPYYEKIEDSKITNLIISDDSTKTAVANEFREMAKYAYRNDFISKEDYDAIMDASNQTFDATDGQAYRSLKSFRKMLRSTGDWTREHERAYKNLTSGKYTIEDQRVLFQTIKPFVFGREILDSGVDGKKISKPIQFKNSEALLFTIFGPQSKSPKLKALTRFMDENGIDVIQFDSATKVGNQGVVNINSVDIQTEKKYLEVLTEAVKLKDSDGNLTLENNPNVVHTLDAEDWGIIAGNPEHLFDAEVLFGTQLRKLIVADIPEGVTFNINGIKDPLTKEQIVRRYSKLLIAQSFKGFKKVFDEVTDLASFENILQKELNSSTMYDDTLKDACRLVDDGNGGKMFNLPIYDPIQSIRVQHLINSIIKRNTVKKKVHGGSGTQAASYGLDELNIRFLNQIGEFIFNENEWLGKERVSSDQYSLLKEKRAQYKSFEEYKKDNTAASEAYWEIYLAPWSQDVLDRCLNEDGTLDINKLPNHIRTSISFRIPTEDKYSMMRTYVKDFLPMNSGSQVIFPKEIVLITGSDFDVDHDYLMKYVFYNRFNPRKAFDSLSKEEKDFYNWQSYEMVSDEDQKAPWNKWLSDLKQNDKEAYNEIINNKKFFGVIPRVNDKISFMDQSDDAINNSLLDLTHALMQHPAISSRAISPGNFDENKRVSYLLSILKSIDKTTYDKEIKGHESDADFLKKKAEQYRGMVIPNSITTQLQFHSDNANGGASIGIYANNNTSHAIMQSTQLELEESLIIDGRSYKSLHDKYVTDDKGNILYYISKQLAKFIGASADNVKEPTLTALNQNQFTINASCLLLRLGVPIETVGLLMNQPAILAVTEQYQNNIDRGRNVKSIIKDVMTQFSGKDVLSNDKINRVRQILNEDLMNNIMHYNGVRTHSEESNAIYNHMQRIYLESFAKIYELGESLSRITSAYRADTSNGANGPSIANTAIKLDRIEKLDEVKGLKNIPFINTEFIKNEDGSINLEKTLERALNSELSFIEGYTLASLVGTKEMLKGIFPHFNEDFELAKELFRDNLKPTTIIGEKLMNKFYNDLFAYKLSQIKEFNTITVEGKVLTGKEFRNYFLNIFPSQFIKEKSSNEELKNNGLIQQLVVREGNKKDHQSRIVFENVGSLSISQKTQLMRDWESLLFSDSERIRKIGLNLFRYCILAQGVSFGPNSFIHLASTMIRKAFPNYERQIRDMIDHYDDYSQFINQFIKNNLFDSQLCPVVSPKSSFTFTDSKGNPAENIILSVKPDSSELDKNILIDEGYEGKTWFAYSHSYISTNINGKVVFYELQGEKINADGGYDYAYKRIDKLGGYEYEYGVDARSMETAVSDKVNKELTSGKTSYAQDMIDETNYQTETGKSMEINLRMFEELAEYEAKQGNNLAGYPAEIREDATGKKPCR